MLEFLKEWMVWYIVCLNSGIAILNKSFYGEEHGRGQISRSCITLGLQLPQNDAAPAPEHLRWLFSFILLLKLYTYFSRIR
jgi:hypothetical protein